MMIRDYYIKNMVCDRWIKVLKTGITDTLNLEQTDTDKKVIQFRVSLEKLN